MTIWPSAVGGQRRRSRRPRGTRRPAPRAGRPAAIGIAAGPIAEQARCRCALPNWSRSMIGADRRRRAPMLAPPRSKSIATRSARRGSRRIAPCPRTSRPAARPSAMMRSPGCSPAAAAALLGLTDADHRRRRRCSAVSEREAERGSGSRAGNWSNGPASDDDRALPHRLGLEGPRALVGRQRQPVGVGHARRVHVAGELDIAAERQPAELPARAALVGPAGDLAARSRSRRRPPSPRTSARRNNGRARGRRRAARAPAGRRAMVSRQAGALASSDAILHTPRLAHRDAARFAHRPPARRRASAAPADRSGRAYRRRLRQFRGSRCARVKESGDRDLVGGVEDRRRARRRRRARARASASAGKRAASGASKSSRPIATRSSGAIGVAIRSGQARQCAIGTRMSGGPSCASTEPST